MLVNFAATFRRINWLQPSVIALVAANLAPLAAVFIFHWDVFSLLFLFWLENAIIGIVNVLKMLLAGVGAKDLPPGSALVFWVLKSFLIPFFCIHYGGFTFIHGIFVVGVFDKGALHGFGNFGFPLIFQIIRDHHLEWPFAGLVISHLISFGWDYLWSGEFRHANPLDLMTQPYRRVVVMHVSILAGGALAMALALPEVALVFLVALKTFIDLWGHQNEREKFSSSKNPALPFSRAPLSPALHNALQARLQAGSSPGLRPQAVVVLIVLFLFFFGFMSMVGYQFVSPFFHHSNRPPARTAAAAPPAPKSLNAGLEWPPDLAGLEYPDTPAAGKFFGVDFSVKRAVLTDSTLSLHDGLHEFVIPLHLTNYDPAGMSWQFPLKQYGMPEIQMVRHIRNSKNTATQNFNGGYSLKLDFGARAKNRIPGKIYLCLPDAQKSHLAGTFDAVLKKERAAPPTAEK